MLNGYKTKLGALGMILSGAGLITNAVASGKFDMIGEGVGLISMGLAAYGLRVAKK